MCLDYANNSKKIHACFVWENKINHMRENNFQMKTKRDDKDKNVEKSDKRCLQNQLMRFVNLRIIYTPKTHSSENREVK